MARGIRDRLRLVVFDLDGTLVDSLADLVEAVNRLLAEHDRPPLATDAIGRMVGEGARLLVQRALLAANIDRDPRQVVSRFLEIYEDLLPGRTRPYPGIRTMLETASTRAVLAVLTNKPTAATRKILSLLDLERFFSAVVGGDGPFHRKPHPDGLLHLVERLGSGEAARAVLVGDSSVDVATARAAGTHVCVVGWGFGAASFEAFAWRGDEHHVDAPTDILTLLG